MKDKMLDEIINEFSARNELPKNNDDYIVNDDTQVGIEFAFEQIKKRSLMMCAFGLLYQRQAGGKIENQVISILIPCADGDDEYDLKAKAERYVSENKKMRADTKNKTLVAYNYSIEK